MTTTPGALVRPAALATAALVVCRMTPSSLALPKVEKAS
jgi:hypothetical protein